MENLLDNDVKEFLQNKNICIIGFMGSGKSYFGERLAMELNDRSGTVRNGDYQSPHGRGVSNTPELDGCIRYAPSYIIDTDKLIEETQNKTISDIFKEVGERGFRKIEKKVLEDIVYPKLQIDTNIIVTGGGLPLRRANQKLLKLINTFNICLNPPFEVILSRIKGTKRPLVYRRSRLAIFNLWSKRYEYYQQFADISISEVEIEDIFRVLNERISILIHH